MVSNMALLSKVINVELVKEFVVMDEEVGDPALGTPSG